MSVATEKADIQDSFDSIETAQAFLEKIKKAENQKEKAEKKPAKLNK